MMQRPAYHSILIVDDDRVSVMACQRALKKLNVVNDVGVAFDGQQALDHLRAGIEKHDGVLPPTVVFLDLNMPRMDGIEFIDRTRSEVGMCDLKVFAYVSPGFSHHKRVKLSERVAGFICKDRMLESFRAALSTAFVHT